MSEDDAIDRDDPLYRQRIEAQHGLLVALGALPAGLIGGLFFALPIARGTDGLPLAIHTTGLASVLLFLGLGLLTYALAMGLIPLVRGFWTLRHAYRELSDNQRIAWGATLIGLGTLGAAAGWLLAFLIL